MKIKHQLALVAGALSFYSLLLVTGCSTQSTNAAFVHKEPNAGYAQVIEQKLVRIEPGTFQMGSSLDEARRNMDEVPHLVTLTKSFWIGISPVTVGQFKKFVTATKYVTDAEREHGVLVASMVDWHQDAHVTWANAHRNQSDSHPVVGVSWNDAKAFCAWLTEIERQAGNISGGEHYTLPTEAQWEYASRAGSHSKYSFGSEVKEYGRYGWSYENSSSTTHPVATKSPNAWGLYDMQGNVWQWCLDWYGDYPLAAVVDPTGPVEGSERVTRGSAWCNLAIDSRVAVRGKGEPQTATSRRGFRIVLVSNK